MGPWGSADEASEGQAGALRSFSLQLCAAKGGPGMGFVLQKKVSFIRMSIVPK